VLKYANPGAMVRIPGASSRIAYGRESEIKHMATTEEKDARVCERCERESAHMIMLTERDNSFHYVCWDCLRREEKHININRRWKRERRA